DIRGDRFWVTDKTGAYSSLNLTGYGTPNHERSESAILLYSKLITSEKEKVNSLIIGNFISYSPSFNNTYEAVWEVSQPEDGDHLITLIRLPVSTLGLEEGDYYYDTSLSVVKRLIAGGDEDVADYEELINPGDLHKPLQSQCRLLIAPKIMMKLSTVYKKYRGERNLGQPVCTDTFFKYLNYHHDFVSALYD